MRIEIEKVQKIKPFEPFVLKMQFDTAEEAKQLRDEILEILESDIESEDLSEFVSFLVTELKNQGYVT
jgi:hypothetical protein